MYMRRRATPSWGRGRGVNSSNANCFLPLFLPGRVSLLSTAKRESGKQGRGGESDAWVNTPWGETPKPSDPRGILDQ